MKFISGTLTKTIRCLLLGASVVILTTGCSYQPTFTASDISSAVEITETRRTIEISPSSSTASDTGLLFYPGGLVDNHVYNQLIANFVETAGVTAVIVKMPANLAVFDIDAGLSVISGFPEITSWVIAGHSLGGSMAASTVKNSGFAAS
jgi:putative intracellular protease/amidase